MTSPQTEQFSLQIVSVPITALFVVFTFALASGLQECCLPSTRHPRHV